MTDLIFSFCQNREVSTIQSVRSFDEQTKLEKTIRALMWQPQDTIKRCEENLPNHVKRKEYREAAACQERIRKATSEIEMWQNLLELYEDEFHHSREQNSQGEGNL